MALAFPMLLPHSPVVRLLVNHHSWDSHPAGPTSPVSVRTSSLPAPHHAGPSGIFSSSPLGEATGMAGIDPLGFATSGRWKGGIEERQRGVPGAEGEDQQEGSTDLMPQRSGRVG